MRQGQTEPDDSYVERFKNNVATVEMVQGSNLFYSPGIVGKSYSLATKQDIYNAKEANLAALMLINADPGRYRDLASNLKKGANLGRDEYPKSIARMYELMTKYTRDLSKIANRGGRKGSVFVQTGSSEGDNEQDPIPGNDGVTHTKIMCFNCGQSGHYLFSCPCGNKKKNGASALMNGTCLAGKENKCLHIPNHRLLLDTCSTDNVCRDISLLKDVKECDEDEVLEVIANGGRMTYKTLGTMKLFPMVSYFNKSSLANIISMKKLSEVEGIRITMDSQVEKSIKVTTKEGQVYVFNQEKDGLYSYDMRKKKSNSKVIGNISNENELKSYSKTNVSFLSTIKKNKKKFTKKEIEKADAARELQSTMGYIADSTLKKFIKNGLIDNCEISEKDVDRATEIYGISEPLARGKMISPTQQQRRSKQIPVPDDVEKEVSLYVDIFYVNGNVFLHVKSKNMDYVSIEGLKNREANTMNEKLKKICNMYRKRGFTITDVYGDNKFNHQAYVDTVLPARLHICAKGEHVPIVERSIRTVKERTRVICQSLPFNRMPKIMVRALLGQVEIWLNQFPSTNRLSERSPATILRGDLNPDYKTRRARFGEYVMVYTGTDNTMESRAVPAIVLKQSNIFGGYYFLSLETYKTIHGSKWQVQPMNDQVIEAAHDLADDENQPTMSRGGPIFDTEATNAEEVEEDDNDEIDESIQRNEDIMFEAPVVSDSDEASVGEEDYNLVEYDVESTDKNNREEFNIVETDDASNSESSLNVRNEEDENNSDTERTEEKTQVEDASLKESSTESECDIEETYSSESDESYHVEDEEDSSMNENMSRALRPRRHNAGTGISRLEPTLRG